MFRVQLPVGGRPVSSVQFSSVPNQIRGKPRQMLNLKDSLLFIRPPPHSEGDLRNLVAEPVGGEQGSGSGSGSGRIAYTLFISRPGQPQQEQQQQQRSRSSLSRWINGIDCGKSSEGDGCSQPSEWMAGCETATVRQAHLNFIVPLWISLSVVKHHHRRRLVALTFRQKGNIMNLVLS